MRYMVNPKQSNLFDPFEHVFSEAAYRVVRKGWQGVFRHVILEIIPVDLLAKHFSEDMGRPTKELYSMAGLVFIMQFKNWTVEEATNAYMFETSVQFALNLEPAGQSLCTRTLERYLKLFRENDVAAAVYTEVGAALVEALDLSVAKQRLDSTHVFSDMALFGRTQLMGVTIKRFLTQVRRHDTVAYEALPESLRLRYAPSPDRLFGEVTKDPRSRQRLRQHVAEEMHELIKRFAHSPLFRERPTYTSLCAVFEQQCIVEQGREEEKEKVVVKEKAGGNVIQNPSDPDATYDGKKGPGYQVQLSETCDEDNAIQVITYVLPQTASELDPEAVLPAVETLTERGLAPETLLADSAYGSDNNVQACKAEGVELISPVNRSRLDPDKLNVGDFTIDRETETVQTCPAGHAPVDSTYNPDTDKTLTHMEVAVCQACPLRERCPLTGNRTRTFRHTPAERRRAERRHEEETEAFRKQYRKRSGIEGTNSGIKRRTGLGRLRVRGRPAVFMAIYLKVAGWNLFRAADAEKMRHYIDAIVENRYPKPLTNAPRRVYRACCLHLRAFWAQLGRLTAIATAKPVQRPRRRGFTQFRNGTFVGGTFEGGLGGRKGFMKNRFSSTPPRAKPTSIAGVIKRQTQKREYQTTTTHSYLAKGSLQPGP